MNRTIPIRMIMAARDGAVDAADKNSIRGTFNRLRVVELDYGHGSIKRPDSVVEDRYRAVVDDLKNTLAGFFQDVCKRCLDTDIETAEDACGEFWQTYEPVVRRYYEGAGGGTTGDDYRNFVRAVWLDAAKRGRPVHDTAGRAAIRLSAKKMFRP